MVASNILKPTTEEVRWWLLHVTQHVCHIEYFLSQLGLGSQDPDRPHDIVGVGNKFEWEVLRGFAVQRRDKSQEFFKMYVESSRHKHRCQYHHRRWNEPNAESTPEDMKLGAVDAICSLLEDREYQGGKHSFSKISEVMARHFSPHAQPWMVQLLPEMRRLATPPIESIISLDDIPNIGIPKDTHDIVRQRVEETRLYLKKDYGYRV